jgi:hypothetical protein
LITLFPIFLTATERNLLENLSIKFNFVRLTFSKFTLSRSILGDESLKFSLSYLFSGTCQFFFYYSGLRFFLFFYFDGFLLSLLLGGSWVLFLIIFADQGMLLHLCMRREGFRTSCAVRDLFIRTFATKHFSIDSSFLLTSLDHLVFDHLTMLANSLVLRFNTISLPCIFSRCLKHVNFQISNRSLIVSLDCLLVNVDSHRALGYSLLIVSTCVSCH